MLENQFIYPSPRGSKLIFFAPLGDGVNEENQYDKTDNICNFASYYIRSILLFN